MSSRHPTPQGIPLSIRADQPRPLLFRFTSYYELSDLTARAPEPADSDQMKTLDEITGALVEEFRKLDNANEALP